MSQLKYISECEFIKKTMRDAYERFLDKKDFSRMYKKAFDIVTTSDYDIEKYIIDRIKKEYAGDRILSEETNSGTAVEGRTWTVDPIDGTYNFANGIPLFGIQCALFDSGQPVTSAIYLPCKDEMYYAVIGGGAYLNDSKIMVRDTELDKCMVSFGDFPHFCPEDALLEKKIMCGISDKIARVRMFGAASVDFAFLASGKTNGIVIFTRNKWDIAPGILLCAEAGAVIAGEHEKYSYDSKIVIAASQQNIVDMIATFLR